MKNANTLTSFPPDIEAKILFLALSSAIASRKFVFFMHMKFPYGKASDLCMVIRYIGDTLLHSVIPYDDETTEFYHGVITSEQICFDRGGRGLGANVVTGGGCGRKAPLLDALCLDASVQKICDASYNCFAHVDSWSDPDGRPSVVWGARWA